MIIDAINRLSVSRAYPLALCAIVLALVSCASPDRTQVVVENSADGAGDVASVAEPVTQADGVEVANEEQAEEPKSWTPSFDSLYEKKRRQRKIVAEDAGVAGGAPGTQKRD
jgi:hypothetical protein